MTTEELLVILKEEAPYDGGEPMWWLTTEQRLEIVNRLPEDITRDEFYAMIEPLVIPRDHSSCELEDGHLKLAITEDHMLWADHELFKGKGIKTQEQLAEFKREVKERKAQEVATND